MLLCIKGSSFHVPMAVPDTWGQGVIFKLAIDSYKMPGYEIWESFTRGKNFPVRACLETRSREGLMVAQFTAGNCWYPGNNAECTNHETSWSLLESHSFWQRCLWSPILTSLHLRHAGMP